MTDVQEKEQQQLTNNVEGQVPEEGKSGIECMIEVKGVVK